MSKLPAGVTAEEQELADQRDRVWLLVVRTALARAHTRARLHRGRWELLRHRRRLHELRVLCGIVPNPPPRRTRRSRRNPRPWVRLAAGG